MRQLKRSRLSTYYVKNRSTEKNNEGVPTDVYSEAFSVKGEIWPATSKRQVEMYGDRISNISNMRIPGRYTITLAGKNVISVLLEGGNVIKPGDGLCVYAQPDQDPDYRVLSITPYKPLKMEIERI